MPWWGGFWKRLIGILKHLLPKFFGRASLNYESLLTIICDCEAVILYISNEPKALIELTPQMFFVDEAGYGMPDCDIIDPSSLCRKLRCKQKLRDDLRRRFRNENLGNSKSFGNKNVRRQIKRKEIVLIDNDKDKRLDWPLARVIEPLQGKDRQIRLVRVVTSRGQLLRSVQRLFHL